MLLDLEELSEHQDEVNRCYSALTSFIIEEAERSCNTDLRKKRKTTKYKEYWDKELSTKWKAMHEAERIYNHHRRCAPRGAETKLRWGCFKHCQKSFDKMLKKKKRAFHRGLLLQIECCNTRDPNKFWEYIRKLGPEKRSNIPWSVEIDGETVTEHCKVLKKWSEDFSSLYRIDSSGFNEGHYAARSAELPELSMMKHQDYDELNKIPSYREVNMAVQHAKTKKAVGLDMIPNELLKHQNVVKLLHKLITKCWQYEMIPDVWRQAIVHPIPKTSTVSMDPLKYRGLALQSCIYKIFSAVINTRIVNHLERNCVLCEEQNGFRKNRSCLHHLHTFNTIIHNRLQQKQQTLVCFVDFRKAFDFTNRVLMYHSLAKVGVTGTVLKLIQQIYHQTENIIRINGEYSPAFGSEQGICQGDVLSPNLFSLFIDGLLMAIKKTGCGVKFGNLTIGCLAYADDIVLFADGKSMMENILKTVQDWCEDWRMLINVDKTKMMCFHRKSKAVRPENSIFYISGDAIQYVTHYKYLGVTFDQHMQMDMAIDQFSKAGSRALGQLIGKTKDNYDLGYCSYSRLFNSCVAPVLDYGSAVWSIGKDCSKLDQVQLRGSRYYLGIPKTAPSIGVTNEMGWTPGVVRRDLEMVRLYNQLTSMAPR